MLSGASGVSGAFMKNVAGIAKRMYSIPLSMMLLAGCLLTCAQPSPAKAGQARAYFKVGLRIDPDLVKQDLARQPEGYAARSSQAEQPRTAMAPNRRDALPRAGGKGMCRKVYFTKNRFRWHCD